MKEPVLSLTNNHMQLELIAVIGRDAFLKRVNDNSYVVCCNIEIHNDFTCTWGFAYGYFEEYDDAYECFMEKVVNRFAEYQNNIMEPEIEKYKKFVQYLLDQWELNTKEIQDKALELIGATV